MSFVDAISEVSRFFNRTLFGGQNETVSSRLGKLERQGVWWARVCCVLISWLFCSAADRQRCAAGAGRM